MHDDIPITLLAAGQVAHVTFVLGSGPQIERLKELGLRDGAEVEMVRTGSPCILRLGNQRLGFRLDELSSILVRTEVSSGSRSGGQP